MVLTRFYQKPKFNTNGADGALAPGGTIMIGGSAACEAAIASGDESVSGACDGSTPEECRCF
jgi:hypothetical protein